MTVLGIDPGKSTGLCLITAQGLRHHGAPAAYHGPARAVGDSVRITFGSAIGAVELWSSWTGRYGDAPDWPAVAAESLAAVAVRERPSLVVVEGFEHRPYLHRAVTTAAEMGRLIGMLEVQLGLAKIPYLIVPASESKAGMGFARRWHRNSHEFSAWCVARYGASQHKLERGTG